MYDYEVWSNGKIDVLVRFYDENGETFGEWTSDADEVPEYDDETEGCE